MKNAAIFKHVINVVQTHSGVSDLKIVNRKREYVDARRVAYHLLRDIHGMTLQSIGNEFNKHHASVLHALRDIDFLIKSDSFINRLYKESLKEVVSSATRKEQIQYEIKELEKEYLTIK